MPMTLTLHTAAVYFTLEQWDCNDSTPPSDQLIAAGEVVEYMAHLAGGMVKVRHKGEAAVIDPRATNELETALAKAIRKSGPAAPTPLQGFA